ncbi:MAG: hypothetical protein GOVbin4162_82 [Prokaryotic dsDNA virus sp.]|nr:MAG: hypothetical protein GOVbin4162_82 [Prokaryotic dsDNA virus sp.]|tara:strand:+ start:659 stop:808 length:150 start_codon:yes stop_codon:yes gene_type:complete
MHNKKKELQYRKDVLSDYLRIIEKEKMRTLEELAEINKELKEKHGVLQE